MFSSFSSLIPSTPPTFSSPSTPPTFPSASPVQQEQKPVGDQAFEASSISSASPSLSLQEKEQQEIHHYNQEHQFLRQVFLKISGQSNGSNIRNEMAQRVEVFLQRIARNGMLDPRRVEFLSMLYIAIESSEENITIEECISCINAKTTPHSDEVRNLLPKLILELKKVGCLMLYDKLYDALGSDDQPSITSLSIPLKEVKIGLDLHERFNRYNDDPYAELERLYS